MKVLSFVALVVALAYANLETELRGRQWYQRHVPQYESVSEKKYEQNKEYVYEYNGQLMTGIPQSSEQHSATRVQALVKIIFKSPQEAFLKIQKIRFGYFNDKVTVPRTIHDFDLFEQVPIRRDLEQQLLEPVQFQLNNGMVQNLRFTEQEQPWSANIKRSVLNMLQVNIQKQRRTDVNTRLNQQSQDRYQGSSLSQESSSMEDDSLSFYSSEESSSVEETVQQKKLTDFFTVMESTLEGECETAYTMVKTQQRPLEVNITKTINFEQCHRRPEIRYNHRFQDFCPTCEAKYTNQERVLQSSTVISQVALINQNGQMLIKNASTESQYTVAPLNQDGNIVQTYVNNLLKLIKVESIKDKQVLRQSYPVESDSDLIYTPDWDILKEEFFLNGDNQFDEESQYSEIQNKKEFITSLIQKLMHYMRESVEEEAPRQFARLVKVMRLLKKQQLDQVIEKFVNEQPEPFTPEEHQKIKSIIIDALALTGTKPSIAKLVELIQENRITPLKAAFALKKLQSTRVISQEMIERIFELTSEQICEETPVTICQSAYLTVGSLLKGLCQPEQDKLAIYFKKSQRALCSRDVKQQWTNKLMERFQQCNSDVCRITVLKTLANAGLDLSIYPLEKIIKNRRQSPIVRVEAIIALRQLIDIMPRKVEKVLMPVFLNKRETPVVRMAAFHKIMQTLPEKFILDQLTQSLTNEMNKQVASFVFTSLQEYANSTNPCEQRVADDLKVSMRHARFLPVNQWILRSKFMRPQYYSQQYNKGVTLDLNSIMSNYSIIPQDIAATLQLNMNSYWIRNAATVGVSQQNVEQYLRHAVRQYSHYLQQDKVQDTLNDILEGRFPSSEETSPKFRKELNSIYDEMSIEEREQEWIGQEKRQSLALIYFRLLNQEYGFLPISKEILPQYLVELAGKEGPSLNKLMKYGQKLLQRKSIEMPFHFYTASLAYEVSHKLPTTLGMPITLTSMAPVVAQARGHLKVRLNKESKKVEIELVNFKPSMTFTAVHKIEMWSPIVNTGLKVLYQNKIYAPINGKLEVSANPEQPQIKLTYKPIDRKFELIRLQTRPVTTVLVWPKSLDQWQEPEERTIQGEEWTRVKNQYKTFGEKALGLKVLTHYQWHQIPQRSVPGTPLPIFAGPNKFVVRVEPGYEMPREIEATVTGHIFRQLVKQTLKPEMNNFYKESDEFLSGSSESSEETRQQQEQYEQYYKEYESEEPLSHQIKVVVQGKGSPVERKVQLTADCMVEKSNKKAAKCQLIVKRTPIPNYEDSEWQLKSTVEFLFPKSPRTVQEIQGEKKFMLKAKTQWGQQSNLNKHVFVKMIGEQSEIMQQYVEESMYHQHSRMDNKNRRSLFSPVAQYEQIKQLAMLDQYKVDVDYKNVPVQMKNATLKLFQWIKYYYFFHTDINQFPQQHSSFKLENEQEGQVRVQFNIDPRSRRYLNASVEMPYERVFFQDVPLATQVNALNMHTGSTPSKDIYSLLVKSVSNYDENICKVRNDRIQTFDQVKYSAPLSTCYSLITKDCTRKSKFAVLARRISEDSELKQVKIITPNVKLVIEASGEGEDIQMVYYLNGQKKQIRGLQQILAHKTHEVLTVTEQEAGYTRVSLPEAGVRVYFDGYAINVKSSPFNSQQLCGLCGQIEAEDMSEECQLRDADNECVNVNSQADLQQFFESFVYTKDEEMECSSSQQKYYQDEEKYDYEPLQWEEQQYFDDEEQYQSPKYSREVNPIRRTRVIEQGHELCFSKQPVKKCPKNTQPVDFQNGRVKIAYTCIDRNDFDAEEYMREARLDRIVPEVKDLKASFTQSERVPESCEKINF